MTSRLALDIQAAGTFGPTTGENPKSEVIVPRNGALVCYRNVADGGSATITATYGSGQKDVGIVGFGAPRIYRSSDGWIKVDCIDGFTNWFTVQDADHPVEFTQSPLSSGAGSSVATFSQGTAVKIVPAGPAMVGLAQLYTPSVHGIVLGTMHMACSGTPTGKMVVRYGTGGAPANGAAAVGTVCSTQVDINDGGTATVVIGFAITGLAKGTQIWLDIEVVSGGAGSTIEFGYALLEV